MSAAELQHLLLNSPLMSASRASDNSQWDRKRRSDAAAACLRAATPGERNMSGPALPLSQGSF